MSIEKHYKWLWWLYYNNLGFNINFKSANTIEKITLFNVLGEEVLSKEVNAQNFDMDISILIPGSYFAKLYSKGQSQTIKLVKFQ